MLYLVDMLCYYAQEMVDGQVVDTLQKMKPKPPLLLAKQLLYVFIDVVGVSCQADSLGLEFYIATISPFHILHLKISLCRTFSISAKRVRFRSRYLNRITMRILAQ